jgi:hypothetical protein
MVDNAWQFSIIPEDTDPTTLPEDELELVILAPAAKQLLIFDKLDDCPQIPPELVGKPGLEAEEDIFPVL